MSRRNFFEINFEIHDSDIKEICLGDSIGSQKLCGILVCGLTPTFT